MAEVVLCENVANMSAQTIVFCNESSSLAVMDITVSWNLFSVCYGGVAERCNPCSFTWSGYRSSL